MIKFFSNNWRVLFPTFLALLLLLSTFVPVFNNLSVSSEKCIRPFVEDLDSIYSRSKGWLNTTPEAQGMNSILLDHMVK